MIARLTGDRCSPVLVTESYGYAGARPLYITRGTDTRYYVQENPGSIAGLFDAAGQITHRVALIHWIDNSETRRDTRPAAGLAGEASFPIGTGTFSVGVRVLTADPVVVTVGWAGIGIRF